MTILLLSLVALCIVSLLAGWLRNCLNRRRLARGEISEMPTIQHVRPDGCCGKAAVCEKESLLAAAGRDIEYYDDEELDAFKGRAADSYTPAEVEQFEEVLTTMRPDDVPGWVRSLQLRGIELPAPVKEEAILFYE